MSSPRLKSQNVAIHELTSKQRLRMFQVMSRYYENVTWEQFIEDLEKKDVVILLTHQDEIHGFSTLMLKPLQVKGRKILGAFSGDTILEKEFWGQSTALGLGFLRHLLSQKLKNPFTPLYWFLISKGYKTYLMMANNFENHYPRYERATPEFEKAAMDLFYGKLYPKNYEPETDLIRFEGEKSCHLKQGIACTSEVGTQGALRSGFFTKKNPHWNSGEELACIAELTWSMPLQYVIKRTKKAWAGKPRTVSAHAAAVASVVEKMT